MSLEKGRYLLLWCSILNYGFVVAWFLLVVLARQWLYAIWGRWFHLSTAQFDRLNFTGMMLYKVGILLFNLVPLVALFIIDLSEIRHPPPGPFTRAQLWVPRTLWPKPVSAGPRHQSS